MNERPSSEESSSAPMSRIGVSAVPVNVESDGKDRVLQLYAGSTLIGTVSLDPMAPSSADFEVEMPSGTHTLSATGADGYAIELNVNDDQLIKGLAGNAPLVGRYDSTVWDVPYEVWPPQTLIWTGTVDFSASGADRIISYHAALVQLGPNLTGLFSNAQGSLVVDGRIERSRLPGATLFLSAYGNLTDKPVSLEGIASLSDGTYSGQFVATESNGGIALKGQFRFHNIFFQAKPPPKISPETQKAWREECGKPLAVYEVETIIGGYKVRASVIRYEKCIKIVYWYTEEGDKPATVITLKPETKESVGDGDPKKEVTVYTYAGSDVLIAPKSDDPDAEPKRPLHWWASWHLFAIDNCPKPKIVQFVKRTVKWSTPPKGKTGTEEDDKDWKIDSTDPSADGSKPYGGTLPAPKQGSTTGGGAIDVPGSAGGGSNVAETDVPDGTTMAVVDDFETFICCDGLLGYWAWNVTLTYVFNSKKAANPTVSSTPASWHKPADSPRSAKVNCS